MSLDGCYFCKGVYLGLFGSLGQTQRECVALTVKLAELVLDHVQ